MDSPFQLSPVTTDELAEILNLQQDGFGKQWSEQQLRSYIEGERALFIGLRMEHRLVGYALFTTLLDEAELLQIAISSDYQGQGLASAFLADCHRQLQQLDIVRVLLEVRVSNVPAIALYNRLGYQQDGIRKGYYPTVDGREDGVLMSCDISAAQSSD